MTIYISYHCRSEGEKKMTGKFERKIYISLYSADFAHYTGKLPFYSKQSVLVTYDQNMAMCPPQTHVGKTGIVIVILRMAHFKPGNVPHCYLRQTKIGHLSVTYKQQQ